MKDQQEEKLKKSNKRKMTKQEKRDTWTVIAILATVFLVAIVIALIKSNILDTESYSGMTYREKSEAAQDARNIIIGAGVVCFVIVVVYVIKRAHRREISEKEFNNYFSEVERLEQAKRRVERARLNKEMEKNEAKVNIRSRKERLGTEATDIDEEERQAYLEKRRREYKYYMENEDEDEGISDELLEEQIDDYSKSNKRWKITALICGVIAILAISAIVLIVIL